MIENDKNRRAQAAKIAAESLAALVDNKEALTHAYAIWLSKLESRQSNRMASIIRELTAVVPKLIDCHSSWKSFLQGNASLKIYAESRIKLAERMKLAIPKDAAAWVQAEIDKNKDLKSYLPEVIGFHGIDDMADGIKTSFNIHILVNKILQQDLTWSDDDLISTLFEHNKIKVRLIDHLYQTLMKAYLLEAIVQWSHIGSFQDRLTKDIPKTELDAPPDEISIDDKPVTETVLSIRDAINQSSAWEDFSPLVNALSKLSTIDKNIVVQSMHDERIVISRSWHEAIAERQLLNDFLKSAQKDNKFADRALSLSQDKVKDLTKQVDKLKERLKKQDTPIPAPAVPSPLEDELKLTRKCIEQFKDELHKKTDELARVESLLRNVLSSPIVNVDNSPVTYTPESLRGIRGVIIGGHYQLQAKLRKELPNSIFYSPDAKSVDENAIKEANYVLFFTGYVNHSLTGHALRLARQFLIPCGYSDKTNVSLVLEDMSSLLNQTLPGE
jgi:hypothetical protein